MSFSQPKVPIVSGWTPSARGAPEAPPREIDDISGENRGENPWREAAALLLRMARRHLWLILIVALACGALAGLAKFLLPTAYKASAQILIDPQESRVFDADAPASTIEANAAINYVESQMGVIGSERVLLRVIRDLGLVNNSDLAGRAGAATPEGGEAAAAPESDEARRARELAENKTLPGLQKAISIQRAERSFLINVTATDKSPGKAAQLANAVLKAYGAVNSMDRNAAARRLASELNVRTDEIRRQIEETETRLQNYKIDHNLVGLHDRAIVERQLSEATNALSAATNREALARARLKQLESAPADMSGVPSLGSDPESRQLQAQIDGRAAARAELAQLASTLGDLHPSLVAARLRLREVDARIAQSVQALRRTARAQLGEAQKNAAELTSRLSDFAAELARTREADVALHEMQDQIDAKRKAKTALEARQREANDMSRVETPSFRIVSPARAPNVQGKAFGALLWAICGALIGAALTLAGLAVAAMFEDARPSRDDQASVSGAEAAGAPPEPAEAASMTLPRIVAEGRRLSRADAMREVGIHPDSAYSEAVAQIYERLRPAAAGPTVALVAATEPRAGASTLAANLARVAAARGRRALLIDAHRAHPSLHLAAAEDAPKTLIELAGRQRPLFRLAPYAQSLSLIPALPDEDELCRAIAEDGAFRPIVGVNGHFDFVVFDGPDAGDPKTLRGLIAAVGQMLLLAPDEADDPDELAQVLRELALPREKFAGFVRAAPRGRLAAVA